MTMHECLCRAAAQVIFNKYAAQIIERVGANDPKVLGAFESMMAADASGMRTEATAVVDAVLDVLRRLAMAPDAAPIIQAGIDDVSFGPREFKLAANFGAMIRAIQEGK